MRDLNLNELNQYIQLTFHITIIKELKLTEVEPKHRGTPATKRGLSNQQVCIITAIQRFGLTIARIPKYIN